jgi:hypothetical protein
LKLSLEAADWLRAFVGPDIAQFSGENGHAVTAREKAFFPGLGSFF